MHRYSEVFLFVVVPPLYFTDSISLSIFNYAVALGGKFINFSVVIDSNNIFFYMGYHILAQWYNHFTHFGIVQSCQPRSAAYISIFSTRLYAVIPYWQQAFYLHFITSA